MEPTETLGQRSWKVTSSNVEAWVTETGGMIAPVRFQVAGKVVEPFSVAPWHDDVDPNDPPLIQALRGDFLCMPFGHSPDVYLGEDHPLHGESANGKWQFDSAHGSSLDLVFECRIRPCKIYKTIRLGDGIVYQKHTVLGLAGPMCFGMHAMLQFNSQGLIGTNKLRHAQVFPGQFEDPAKGGYSSLASGAEFSDPREAPLAHGGVTNLTVFPNREGFEDLVQLTADPVEQLGWTAVTFPSEGHMYFQLKDLKVLPSTVLWFSNGGRHYRPWNGRHRGVLGIEEVCSYFHLGLRGSVSPNAFQAAGIPTYRDFHAGSPLDIRIVQGIVQVPAQFDRVAHVAMTGSGVVFVSESGERVEKQLDVMFLGLR